ncbi:MAG: ATP-binding protein [Dehalococcoidia bacterium]
MAFVSEAEDQIRQLNRQLVSLERDASSELFSTLLRTIHNLKGSAATAGLSDVAESAHYMEDLLCRIQDGADPASPGCIDMLLWRLAQINAMVAQLRDSLADDQWLELPSGGTGRKTVRAPVLMAAFPHMMSDLSVRLEKPIAFRMAAGDCEADPVTAKTIAVALVHLLRNALDHGIERQHVRLASGKPETGTIEATMWQEGELAFARVTDDGRGIDAERITAAAVKKRLISQDSATRLSHAEAIDLIFLPGLSTRKTATVLSGRGIGLDAVRAMIQAIGGKVDLITEPGKGTTFTLCMPTQSLNTPASVQPAFHPGHQDVARSAVQADSPQ